MEITFILYGVLALAAWGVWKVIEPAWFLSPEAENVVAASERARQQSLSRLAEATAARGASAPSSDKKQRRKTAAPGLASQVKAHRDQLAKRAIERQLAGECKSSKKDFLTAWHQYLELLDVAHSSDNVDRALLKLGYSRYQV